MNTSPVFALLSLSLLLAGCGSDTPGEAIAPSTASTTAANTPSWEIGEDIAGKKVVIDGKEEVIPDDVADTKRKMDAVAKEKLEAMDALEKERLQRFNDPDMKP